MTAHEERNPAAGIVSVLTVLAATTALGMAWWLYPASAHIVDWPRSGPHRVAVFAPLYQLTAMAALVAVAVVAMLVTVRRRRGSLATWAHRLAPLNILWMWTVPYWPWLPDRLPLLVALAGPIRWVFATLAVGGVLARSVPFERLAAVRPGRRFVFACSLIVYLGFGIHALRTTGLGGDEPHYLIITQSLILDGDLQIENNHTRGDYKPYFGGDLRPDYMTRGRNLQIYSIHAPGLSALLVPGYLLAGASGAVATMCVLAALAALAVFEIAGLVAGSGVALATWGVLCLTVPFIPHAWSLFPEMAGTAIVAWAVLWGMRSDRVSLAAWAWRGVSLACLPWLHTKFSVLMAGLAVFVVWQLRDRWRHAAVFLAPMAVSGVAWLASFYAIYGVFSPEAPYGDYATRFVRLENVPRSLFGLLFDQKFGLLLYAPAYALALPGFWMLGREKRWRVAALAALAVIVGFTVSSARLYMWWGGSSAPARFLVPLTPLFAPAVALAFERLRGGLGRTTAIVCAVLSVLVGVSGAIGTGQFLLYSAPHGVSRILLNLQGSAPLTEALPTFTQPEWMVPALGLAPWAAAVAAAVGAGWLTARVVVSSLWIGLAEVIAFMAISSLLMSSLPPQSRAAARTRGDLALIERFDPVRARAFDYARMARLSPPEWVQALSMSFDRTPGSEPDAIGRLTDALHLPPGTYTARVWFDGRRALGGALQATVGYDNLLARLDAPLPNPAELTFTLPVAVPVFWLQLTDLESARAVRRLEIDARSVEPASARSRADVLAVEATSGWMNGYLAYLGGAYPENGVFWTRATEAARLLLVPAGAGTAIVRFEAGPVLTDVRLAIGGDVRTLALKPRGTAEVRVPLPAGVSSIPVEVQASAAFRPSEVDSSSSDTRQLGCRVRLVLE